MPDPQRRLLLRPHAELLVVLPVRLLAVPGSVEGGTALSALVEGGAAVAVGSAAVGFTGWPRVGGGGAALLFAQPRHSGFGWQNCYSLSVTFELPLAHYVIQRVSALHVHHVTY